MAPAESEAHRQWKATHDRNALWRADYAAQLGRALAVPSSFEGSDEQARRSALENAHQNAKLFADECERLRAHWEQADADVVEPPYLEPADRVEGELPGHVPGSPGDAFARRPPFNPYT
jgi:hypothetical protein